MLRCFSSRSLVTDRESDRGWAGQDRGFKRGGSERKYKGGTALCSIMYD
jgi:hypothetical protein